MNSISWLIYGIDVAGGIKMLAGACAIACSVILLGSGISVPASEGETWDWFARNAKWLIGGPVLAWTLFIFVPEKQTLYAIAASQIGERVIQNDAVQGIASDATKALQQWIKRQIEPDAK